MDQKFLEGTESSTVVYNGDGVRTSNIKRKNLLIYPDYRDGWFSWTYHTDFYFNYLLKNGLLNEWFKTGEDLQLLHLWVAKAYEWKTEISPESYSNPYPLPDESLKKILTFVDWHPDGKSFDKNLLYLILANHAYEKGDSTSGLTIFSFAEPGKYHGFIKPLRISGKNVLFKYGEKSLCKSCRGRQISGCH